MTTLNVSATVTGTVLTIDIGQVANALGWTLNTSPVSNTTNTSGNTSNTSGNTSNGSSNTGNTSGNTSNTSGNTNTSNTIVVTNVPNVTGIVADGTAVLNNGFDADGDALSATLLGTSKTWANNVFSFGKPSVNNAYSSTNIYFVPAPAAAVEILAAAVNGNQTAQKFVVTYTDNTTTTFTQSLSDWATPQSYAGEATAVSMVYRLTNSGAQDASSKFNLYGYAFPVVAGKSVKSLTLPANRNVVVVAAVLSNTLPANTSSNTSNTSGNTSNTSGNTSNTGGNTSNTVVSSNAVVTINNGTMNGSTLTFTGSGFSSVTGVTLVGAGNLSYTLNGDTGINITIPGSVGGAGQVAITTAKGTTNVWFSTNAFDFFPIGSNYLFNTDNFGGNPNQLFWGIDQTTWGFSDTQTTDRFGIAGCPGVSVGWSQNQSAFNALGGTAMAVNRGMGKSVTALKSAKISWTLSGPTYPAGRWDALCDNYFHQHNNPNYSEFYPYLDLMIMQMISDQLNSDGTTYYQTVCKQNHATTVTIGGNSYTVFVDDPGNNFNQAGGHTIWMALQPNAFSVNANPSNPVWGKASATHDLAAIIQFWMQSAPKDDAGKAIVNAAGNPITSALITPDLYWNESYSGIEVDYGTSFKTSYFDAQIV